MKSTSDIKKELERQKAEMEKMEKAYCKSKANDDYKKATLNNEELCEIIGAMPSDEVIILFNEILNSKEFLSVFRSANKNSTKLKRIRAGKAAKAERRKAKNAQEKQSEQTDILQVAEPAISSEANNAEEALTQSEQAELSEQNTQSDPFTHTAAEPPTDFSQKWDQVTSQEQTEPPAYPGSIY